MSSITWLFGSVRTPLSFIVFIACFKSKAFNKFWNNGPVYNLNGGHYGRSMFPVLLAMCTAYLATFTFSYNRADFIMVVLRKDLRETFQSEGTLDIFTGK